MANFPVLSSTALGESSQRTLESRSLENSEVRAQMDDVLVTFEFIDDFRTASSNQIPIRILSDNAILITKPLFGETILGEIQHGNKIYVPDPNTIYWVLNPDPKHFVEGALYFREVRSANESRAFIVKQRNFAPFLDLSGTFHYQGIVLGRENGRGVWSMANANCILFQSEGKYKAILDQETHLMHSIEPVSEFMNIW